MEMMIRTVFYANISAYEQNKSCSVCQHFGTFDEALRLAYDDLVSDRPMGIGVAVVKTEIMRKGVILTLEGCNRE